MPMHNKKKANANAAGTARKQEQGQVRQEVIEMITTLLHKEDEMPPAQHEAFQKVMAEAGIIGSSLRKAHTIRKSDDFVDRMHEQTLALIEAAHEMTLPAEKRAGPAPEELLKALQRVRDMLSVNADSEQQADWRKQGCPVTKPLAVGKPLKLKPPARG